MSSILKHYKVASIQMNCVLYDKEENLNKANKLIEEAIERGAKLIVLPELFNTGYRVEEKDDDLSESIPGSTSLWMTDICRKANVYMIAAILEKGLSNGTVYDTALLVGPEGLIGTYRKTHLWDQENVRFTKGNAFPVFNTELGKIGLQICYEVGFPEGARLLTLKGADIIAYPSAFGAERYYAWDLATRARGLENGAFIVASNRSGTEKEVTAFGGHSRIVGPSGNILAESEEEEDQVIVADVDLNEVIQQRRAIPYLRDLDRSMFQSLFNNNN